MKPTLLNLEKGFFRKLGLLLSWGVVFTIPTQGAPLPSSPTLDLNASKTEFYRILERWVPYLFEETFEWDSDLEGVVKQERDFLLALRSNPTLFSTFKSDWKARPPARQIVVESLGKALPAGWVLSTEAEIAIQRAHKSGVISSSADQIAQSLRNDYTLIQGKSPRGILTGLIRQLPQTEWAEVFRLSPKGQIEALRKRLPPGVLPQGFDAARFNLDSGLNLTALFEQIDSLLQVEERISLLSVALARAQHTAAVSTSDPSTGELISNLEKPLRERATLAIRTAYERKDSSERERIPELVLVEMPPYLASYRGLIGGDCSTSSSPFYPYSPSEYDYFIYQPNGALVGYLGATKLGVGKDPNVLYIHDVTGRDLTPRDVDLALHGLFKARKRLGFSGFTIATKSRLDSNMHFPTLVERLNQRAQTRTVNLKHQDVEIRNFISGHVIRSGYDSAERNSEGRPFKSDEQILSSVRSKVEASPVLELEMESPKRIEAILLGAKLMVAGQDDSAKQVFGENGFGTSDYKKISSTMKNQAKRKISEFYREAREVLGLRSPKYSSEWAQIVRSKGWMFEQGHKNAKDFLNPPSSEMKVRSEKLFFKGARAAIREDEGELHYEPWENLEQYLNSQDQKALLASGFKTDPRLLRMVVDIFPTLSPDEIQAALNLKRLPQKDHAVMSEKVRESAASFFQLPQFLGSPGGPEAFLSLVPNLAGALVQGRLQDHGDFETGDFEAFEFLFARAAELYPQCIPQIAKIYFQLSFNPKANLAERAKLLKSMESFFGDPAHKRFWPNTDSRRVFTFSEVYEKIKIHRILVEGLVLKEKSKAKAIELPRAIKWAMFSVLDPEFEDSRDNIGPEYAERIASNRGFTLVNTAEFADYKVMSRVQKMKERYSGELGNPELYQFSVELEDLLESEEVSNFPESLKIAKGPVLEILSRVHPRANLTNLSRIKDYAEKLPWLKRSVGELTKRLAKAPAVNPRRR